MVKQQVTHTYEQTGSRSEVTHEARGYREIVTKRLKNKGASVRRCGIMGVPEVTILKRPRIF